LPPSLGLRPRILLLAGVLVAEALVASVFLDGDQLMQQSGWLTHLLNRWAAWALRFALLFAALFGASFIVNPGNEESTQAAVATFHSSRAWLAHAGFLACFAVASYSLYGADTVLAYPNVVTALWGACTAAVAMSAALAVLPVHRWIGLLVRTRARLAGSAAAAAVACALGAISGQLWEPARWATFRLVELVLHPILPSLIVQPERFRIATGVFGVIISPECSGLEGIGLLLIFGVMWSLAYWRDIGIARCLLLLGGGLVALYFLNVLRIATLILIGHYGAANIAKAGFHSQAGWIAFSSVALGLTFVARHLAERPLRRAAGAQIAMHNPAAPLLVPFLAAVAAAMIAGAASAGFEWLYGLRVLAAAMAIWYYRQDLRSLRWTAPSAYAVVTGILVFGVWMVLEAVIVGRIQFHQALAPELAAAPALNRVTWLTVRVIGGVVAVPLIEELAFRAYLLRRLQASDFEQVPLQRFHPWAVFGSSVVFGALHGERWLAATLAGGLYAWVATRRGAISDAVFAHALTNALIAALVLFAGTWNLW
jgi:exosortase E/protease (VPEID-CTERM system)